MSKVEHRRFTSEQKFRDFTRGRTTRRDGQRGTRRRSNACAPWSRDADRGANSEALRVAGVSDPRRPGRAAICDFALRYPKIGYRKLTWMMVDAPLVGRKHPLEAAFVRDAASSAGNDPTAVPETATSGRRWNNGTRAWQPRHSAIA
jgi:hypothetical protein